MQLKIEIICNSAAFEEDSNAEVRRILLELCNELPQPQIGKPLYDIDGNRVGTARWTPKP
jgi:hypothetical protein